MTRIVIARTALIIAITVGVALSLGTGSADLSIASSFDALFGRGEEVDIMIVQQWRMPRACAAIVFGAGLAVSGALMQQTTRNPLGSPDVIGFDTGAFTGALIAGIVLGGTFTAVTGGALLGGIIAATVVFFVSRVSGGGTFQLIIVGIAMSAFLSSLNTWIILAADVKVAMSAASWALGSLNDVSWERFLPAAVVIVITAIPVILIRRPLQLLALGDPLARGLGSQPARVRLLATFFAVLLSAVVVAVCGPIAFVALSAPHVATLMTGRRGFHILDTALTGAALLTLADLLALRLIADTPLPVGAVTVSLGGAYLAVLIALGARKRKAQR